MGDTAKAPGCRLCPNGACPMLLGSHRPRRGSRAIGCEPEGRLRPRQRARETAREFLLRSQPPEKVAELLATGTWTHDFPITVDVAQRLG